MTTTDNRKKYQRDRPARKATVAIIAACILGWAILMAVGSVINPSNTIVHSLLILLPPILFVLFWGLLVSLKPNEPR